MNSKVLAGAIVIALAGFSVQGLAGTAGVSRQPTAATSAAKLTQLEQARANVVHNQQLGDRGPLLIHDMDKRAQLDDLISRLQNGEPVDPAEVDQATQR